jgi:hypothetical protein
MMKKEAREENIGRQGHDGFFPCNAGRMLLDLISWVWPAG